jgi:hypothetical protein
MKNYIDESGTFGWTPEGVSLFAGLSLADRSLSNVTDAFKEWKLKIAGFEDATEVKGWSLSREQLEVFVKCVILPHRDFWVTLVAFDTRNTREAIARVFVEQAVDVAEAAGRLAEERGNPTLARDFRKWAVWIRHRSPQNGLWLLGLARTILNTMQHTIIRHMDVLDDPEFENWDIIIDRSSIIETSRHEEFWGGWLRSVLYQQTTKEPLSVITEWRERDHPFVRKYVRPGDIIDASDLFKRHMRFGDSKAELGLQMADVCAAIVRRFHVDGWREPYERMVERVVRDERGDEMLTLCLDETSLRSGPPESGIKFMDSPPSGVEPD